MLSRQSLVEQFVIKCSHEGLVECRLGSAGIELQRRLCNLQESTQCSTQKIRRKPEINKPFTPVPVHRPRSKVPSNTKVSKLYARIKNMERNRAMQRRQIRGFKSSHAALEELLKDDKRQLALILWCGGCLNEPLA